MFSCGRLVENTPKADVRLWCLQKMIVVLPALVSIWGKDMPLTVLKFQSNTGNAKQGLAWMETHSAGGVSAWRWTLCPLQKRPQKGTLGHSPMVEPLPISSVLE